MSNRALRLAVLIAAFCFSAAAGAACVRYVPDPRKPPEMDGPGSFGKLQDTVTLDCLSYAGSIGTAGAEQVLIRDERGTVYRLRVGDYMGENTGVIRKIDDEAIYIEQLIREGKDYKQVMVRFAKTAKPAAH
jgi:hypothetical protein